MREAAQWERFARLRDRVETSADALTEVRATLGPIEAELWDEADALTAGDDRQRFHEFAQRAWRPVDAALTRLAV